MKTPACESTLRSLAWVSGVYDLLLGLPLLVAPDGMARLFGAPAPIPTVNAQLNGVFAFSIAIGFFWAARAQPLPRGYLWTAGVLAKGLGATLLVLDHVVRHSPPAFLLFALSDGVLAIIMLLALARRNIQYSDTSTRR